MSLATLIFFSVFLVVAVAPEAMMVLVALCLIGEVCIIAVQISARLVQRTSRTMSAPSSNLPYFSVHVACHNEPPGLVCDTIRALHEQDYPNERYEVIVIDNNTSDPAKWVPVRDYCASLRVNMRFFHRMDVKGAKAGALNIALDKSAAEATHIVTIDSDYVVSPGFLSCAARVLEQDGSDFLQFPQAYRHVGRAAHGISLELEDYFSFHARSANGTGLMLPTGTLSVIDKKALENVGGWPTDGVTEDAHLGYILCAAGYQGRFIDRAVGHGILPLALSDFEQQRFRWSNGNARVLRQAILDRLQNTNARGSLRQTVVIASQLTAWLSFLLIPVAALLGSLLFGVAQPLLIVTAALCVIIGVGRSLLPLVIGKAHNDLRTLAGAVANRLALLPAAARGTVEATLTDRAQFVVTRKDGGARSDRLLPRDHIALLVLAALAAPAALATGPLACFALLPLFVLLPAAHMTRSALEAYRRGPQFLLEFAKHG
ncbi:glycosyltransferase family 2 protein [uncultured Roseobacter sp.]|uniref:glycosyltransferase family 2 protein n=1 Tax=uncultured Roseobacter sp. TaxID=114847 RepID=UPI00262305A0|nr:glycosyltransferase family 2 protein [uncultured Roseobacter sp.]